MTSQVLIPEPSALTKICFKKILFATDFSEASRHAQRYAVTLARLFGARLFALHVESPMESLMPYGDVSPSLLEKIRNAREIQMRLLQDSLEREGIPFACMLETGDIRQRIKEIIHDYSIDLVVLGTHGRQGLDRVVLGSTAEGVFRSINLPVLTVGPHSDSFNPRQPVGHIVYATDFTKDSEAAASYAVSLAEEFHAGLTVVHVIPEGETFGSDHEHMDTYFYEKLRKLVPQFVCDWCDVEYVVENGDTVERVLAVADERRTDLIVLGIHDAISFMSHLPGRTAYQIVCQANCPVLTVLPRPAETFASESPERQLRVFHS
ncbi:MAG TPA: universal stress protein [Terriglobales bacterium]